MLFDDLNKVELLGNITQDLELKHSKNGTAILNFSIATSRSVKTGDNKWEDVSQFTNCTAFGSLAENLYKWAKKGTRVLVEGRIQTDQWKNDAGENRYTTKVIASNVLMIARYRTKEEASAVEGIGTASGEPLQQVQPDVMSATIDPDDLPF